MYLLVDDQSVKFPYNPQQLRSDNPSVSFPVVLSDEVLSVWNVYPVQETEKPVYDNLTQNLVQGTPVIIEGKWTQVWQVQDASAEEIAERKQRIKRRITDAVQERLDIFAQTRGYDNIVSACSYATSNHSRYGPEGRYCVQAREATWDKLFEIESEVLAGTRPMPRTYAEIEPELPALAWPA